MAQTEVRMDDYTLGAFQDQLLMLEQPILEEEYGELYWANEKLIPIEYLDELIPVKIPEKQGITDQIKPDAIRKLDRRRRDITNGGTSR